MQRSKKIALTSVLAALSIVFGYIETLIPAPIPIPGIKLGLGNIVILLSLYSINKKSAFFVMLIKATVTTLLFGTPMMLIYSLSGGILSFIIMCIMKKTAFHTVSVSIGGGIFHNLGQIIAAAFVFRSLNVFYYLPVLIISGSVFAAITGTVASNVIRLTVKML